MRAEALVVERAIGEKGYRRGELRRGLHVRYIWVEKGGGKRC
jgi:hypothetical protein